MRGFHPIMLIFTRVDGNITIMSDCIRYYTYMDSPVGRLMLTGQQSFLMTIEFPEEGLVRTPQDKWLRDDNLLTKTVGQLNEYFSGSRKKFSVAIHPQGTDFQKKVWDILQDIPYGETISYGEVASRLGQPTASRAVGAANNANPLPIIVPCHRVIGADGSMVGFGGGIGIKLKLLELEYHFDSASRPQGDLFT